MLQICLKKYEKICINAHMRTVYMHAFYVSNER